jgi:hypothetical protein
MLVQHGTGLEAQQHRVQLRFGTMSEAGELCGKNRPTQFLPAGATGSAGLMTLPDTQLRAQQPDFELLGLIAAT